jgi:hypothetical protein
MSVGANTLYIQCDRCGKVYVDNHWESSGQARMSCINDPYDKWHVAMVSDNEVKTDWKAKDYCERCYKEMRKDDKDNNH